MNMSATDVSGLFRSGDRLVPPDRNRRRTLAAQGWLSLLLHLLVLALLVFGIVRRRLSDVVSPSTVAVVFDGGPPATTPQTQESRRSTPTTAPNPKEQENVSPGAAPAAPPRPSQPPPHPQQPPQQQQAQPPAPATLETVPGGLPAAEIPAVPRGPAPLVLPPPAIVSRPGSVPRPPARQAQRAPAPRAPAESASPFASLGAPMEMSLSGHPPPPASEGHLKRGINLTMAPTDQNRNVMTRYAEARHKLGEDWWSAFSAFVQAHKYYPLEAAKHGEDGQCVLHLVIARDGTVRSVQVELSSGSDRLDTAWVSEFRGAKVPPFPPGTIEDQIAFPASMTYILEHW